MRFLGGLQGFFFLKTSSPLPDVCLNLPGAPKARPSPQLTQLTQLSQLTKAWTLGKTMENLQKNDGKSTFHSWVPTGSHGHQLHG